MAYEWNEAQKQAIYTHGQNILVAAGAGSGKTTVLVERVIQRLLAEDEPISVEQLLVLTFTNAAAQEMRQRIDKQLAKRLEEAPSEWLQDQLALLPQAAIGTIHSFCLEVIRHNFIEAGIDAGFRIPAEADVTLLAAEVLERYLEEQYRSNSASVFALADAYGGKRDDSELEVLILSLYRFVVSQPNADAWLDAAAARFTAAEMPQQQVEVFRRMLSEELEMAEEHLRHGADIAAREVELHPLQAQFIDEADMLLAVRNAPNLEEMLRRLTDVEFRRLASIRVSDAQKSCSEEVQKLRNAAKYAVQKLQKKITAAGAEEAAMAEMLKDEKFVASLSVELEKAEGAMRAAVALCAAGNMPQSFRNQLEDEAEMLRRVRSAPNLLALLQSVAQVSFGRMATLRAEGDVKSTKEEAQGMRNSAKDLVGALNKVVAGRTVTEIWAEMQAAAPLMAELVRLAKGFMAEFTAEKRRRNWLDFNDMEHLCLKVLADESNGVAAAYRQRFAEVLVDEYQDTNPVQEAILCCLENGSNRFAVGDVKQSIYRFRMADPGLFLQKHLRYGAGEGGLRIDLNSNYRSKNNILQAVNYIFSCLMSEDLGDIVYDDAAALHPGKDDQEGGVAVELHLINMEKPDEPGDEQEEMAEDYGSEASADAEAREDMREQTALAAEVALVICQIRDLCLQGYKLSDMAILLRSTKNRESFVAEKLLEANMMAVTDSGSDSLASPEVRLLVAALRVIDNPLNDLPLATLLRSPLCGFTADELTEIRLMGSGYYYHGLCARAAAEDALASKCSVFIERLQKWQLLAKEERLSQLIARLMQENGYFRLVGAMADGEQRQDNLRAFMNLARSYEQNNYRGLYRFLCFLQDTEKRKARAADSKKAEEQNAVRIMSIHKSKGLEFPIVFVCGMGNKFNFRYENSDVLWHKDLGLGPMLADRSRHIKYPTLAHRLVAWQNDHDSRAEELRVLYVALTRAKERLIIMGADRKLNASLRSWQQSAATETLSAAVLRKDSRPLDWLCRAVMRHRDGSSISARSGVAAVAPVDHPSRWSVNICDGNFLMELLRILPQQMRALQNEEGQNAVLPPAEWQATDNYAAVDAVLSYRYPYAAACNYPAKWSVSQLNSEQAQRFVPAAEDAADALRREAALRRGTLNHLLLQLVDLPQVQTLADLQQQAADMAARGLFNAEEAALLDLPALFGFIRSPLGQRMTNSSRLWREFPFTALLPAEGRVEAAADDALLLQGTIDALFEEDGKLILVDYKTGGRGKSDAQLAESYRVQLQQYSRAVQLLFGKAPAEAWLYMLDLQRTVKVEL